MSIPQDIPDTAKLGADSVFEYVARTAEVVPNGVRWRTLSYRNEPQYDVSVFNGVAGISLFLSDYHHLTGDPEARDLALDANRWCSAPERTVEDESLCFGRSGVGMAWLQFSIVTGDQLALARACEIGDRLLTRNPGPVTDFIGGAAGEGVFLLRLHKATGENRYLSGAARNGEWLRSLVLRDGRGTVWPMRAGESPSRIYLGFAHGISGTAFFLLLLHEATQDARWAELAREVAETLSAHARPDHGGLNWPPLTGTEAERCQWCHGSPGVGLFYLKAHEVLGDSSFLQAAEAAGEATFQHGDIRSNPSQCHGLSGNAELFLELYRITRNALWLDRAHDFARRALTYRRTGPEGDSWQADEPGHESPDFMCGATGAGHFFLRLGAPDTVRMPLT